MTKPKWKPEKVTVVCAGCGREQHIRKSKVLKCDLYTCSLGSCKLNPDWKPERPLNAVMVIEMNAAGGFSGIRFKLPTADDLASIERARAIRDAALKRMP